MKFNIILFLLFLVNILCLVQTQFEELSSDTGKVEEDHEESEGDKASEDTVNLHTEVQVNESIYLNSTGEIPQNETDSKNETSTKPRPIASCIPWTTLKPGNVEIKPNLVTDQPKLEQENGTDTDIEDPKLLQVEVESANGELEEKTDFASVDSPILEEVDILEPKNEAVVQIVNMTELLQDVLWSNSSVKSRSNPGLCSIVLFYSPSCPFSAKAAPHFNALARAFRILRTAAIDITQQPSAVSTFGILAVPTVLIFHNGRSVAKFNETLFTLSKFSEFIRFNTDLSGNENATVTSQDFIGPLSSVPVKTTNYYLITSWMFILACFIYYVRHTIIWRRMIDLIRTTWREAEDHVHQD